MMGFVEEARTSRRAKKLPAAARFAVNDKVTDSGAVEEDGGRGDGSGTRMGDGGRPQEDVDVESAKNNKDDSFYDNVNQEDINDCIDDDGEVEIDIAETEKLEKMLDTHYKVMEMTFKSQGDAYMFYNNHAKEHGFGIRKEKVKRGKGPA
ncbi:hypothetical protein D1007_58456 [Hordeum vulgare]|nr:hypothetical protein D1007_58456 [Hordeum vulgare]